MSHKIFRLIASLILALGYILTPTTTAYASGFTVDSTVDAVDINPGDGTCASATDECTLRAAIQEANALPSDDTISLPSGTYTLAILGVDEDSAAAGDLDITNNLTINATDNASTIIDGGAIDRVFHILSNSNVEIKGATIQNGRILARGGGLYVEAGTLVLNNSIIRNNTASWGGIFNGSGSTATLNSSTVMDNIGFYNGGGIYNQGTITLNNSTVSGNTAGTGGGFDSDGLTILNNSTISGNTAPDAGGFYVSSGSLFLNNSTVSNNSATDRGGGIYKAGVSSVALKNSIVAGNSALTGPDCYGDIYIPIVSSGYNLIGNSSDCIMISAPGDLLDVDPLLAPLADNGGPTLTHSLLPGSPSIDAGNPVGCTDQDGNPFTTDQRGVARPQGPRCDIGAFEFEGEPGLPPSNDNFADATIITTLPYSDSIDNTFATVETDEPLPTNCYSMQDTVWYAFTPAEKMVIRASVVGSAINTSLKVYRALGVGFSNLAFWGCTSTGYVPAVLTLEGGQTYYLQAGSIYGETGTVQINLEEIPPPANDYFANAEAITSLPFTSTVNNGAATRELDEPEQCAGTYNTVWYSFTPSETMMVQADTDGSTLSANINIYRAIGSGITQLEAIPNSCTRYHTGIFLAEAGQTYYLQAGGQDPLTGNLQVNFKQILPPDNDNFANATVISSSLPFDEIVNTAAATSEVGEPISDCAGEGGPYKSIWYSYTPTASGTVSSSAFSTIYPPLLAVYTGNALDNLNELGCQVFSSNPLTFSVDAGNTYYFQISKYATWVLDGSVQFQLRTVNPPANDNFNNAMAIGTLPFSNTVDTTDATAESGEPLYCYTSLNNTVWYSFTPAENALVKFDLQGSNFWNSVVNVYQATGPNITDLSPVQCAGFGNSAMFTAEAGTTYYFQAGGAYGSSGNLQLNLVEVPRPANNDFAKATLVPLPLPFDHPVDTQYASRQTGEPTPSCASYGPGTRSVWYAFTPATSGSVSANIPSAGFTPVLGAFTGNSLNNLTQIGCQTYSSLLTFRANAGTTYYFQVGNYYPWEQGGSMQFHLDVAPQPIAGFYYSPSDPSIFDTIQFYDASYDPGQVGIQSYSWDFGDGTTSTSAYPTHKYTADGDYTVQHSVTTPDGRTASTTQVVQVKTHDVAIVKVTAPVSANAGQTRTITVTVRNKRYPETVTVDLYKSTPGGEVWVDSITLLVPVSSGNRTTTFSFSYTFTSQDVQVGKVTFRAVASISNARDSYPSDNTGISSPPTKVVR